MALTQARAFGAGTGSRYGSFAGKGAGAHPVEVLTQPAAHGAFTHRRYGSFEGKTRGGRERLTQARTFGAFTGRRYGLFVGREELAPPSQDQGGGGVRFHARPHKDDEQQARVVTAALEKAAQERREVQRAAQTLPAAENAPAAPISRPAEAFEQTRKPTERAKPAKLATQASEAEMLQRELKTIERQVAEAKRTAEAEEFQRVQRDANNRRAQILIALMMLGQ